MESRMVQTVRRVARVDDTGLVHLGPLEDYSFGGTLDETEDELYEALALMVSSGEYEIVSGSYYEADTMEAYLEQQEEEMREHRQYLDDIDAAYATAKGFV